MGKTVYQKINEMIELLKNEAYETLSEEFLKIQIKKYIGADKRTVENTLSFIKEAGIIKKDENGLFRL